MRITRDLLLTTAKETVKRYTFGSHDLVCAYITGSLVYKEPLIGGCTDIDLIYVHSIDAPIKREIIPVAEDFHLDIAHLQESIFSQPRSLRADPWVGSFLCHYPIPVFDQGHWFEYTQAGVFAHFFQPSNIIQRVKPFAESARADWLNLQISENGFTAKSLRAYLQIMKDAANAIACLVSVPLTDRRFMIDYPLRTQDLKMPGLAGGLVDLILPEEPIEPNWESWLADWRTDFTRLQRQPDVPLTFSNGRMPYYQKAIEGLKESRQDAALWILLWTWTELSSRLYVNSGENLSYSDFCRQLTLGSDHFQERISALDAYLDVVEETIDRWVESNGL
ncbi:MAG TPA: hypothetical protein VMW28_02430 [Pelolinea sp.]|nr:hypothetical protein [Pelolinea sp.]